MANNKVTLGLAIAGWTVVVAFLIALTVLSAQKTKSTVCDNSKISRALAVKRKPVAQSHRSTFLWGAGSAAFQIEGNLNAGGRKPSIWDDFIQNTDKVGSPDLACNSYYQWQEDIDLLSGMGATAYRFSISWSRLIPGGTLYANPAGTVLLPTALNPAGMAYYNRLINELIARGIAPVVTLYHWDLPIALQAAYGGWLCTESYASAPSQLKIVTDFQNYAELCFKSFGDRVKHWATLNEPQTVAVNGYEYPWFAPGASTQPGYGSYPGTATADGNAPGGNDYRVAFNMLIAHASAYREYHSNWAGLQQGQVGLVCNMDWAEPYDPSSAADVAAAQRGNVFWGGWFWDPIFFGDYSETMKTMVNARPPINRLPVFTAEQSALVRGSVDLFMLNTYSTYFAQDFTYPAVNVGWTYDQGTNVSKVGPNGLQIGGVAQSSWLYIVPTGVGKLIRWIQNRYSRPQVSEPGGGIAGVGISLYDTPTSKHRTLAFMITENGVDISGQSIPTNALEAVDDYIRYNNYYAKYLEEIEKATATTGVKFVGYLAWSLMDNLEWASGFTCRFGLTYINFLDKNGKLIPKGGPKVKLARVPKDSSRWLANYFLNHKV
jgi:beta-glucosidase